MAAAAAVALTVSASVNANVSRLQPASLPRALVFKPTLYSRRNARNVVGMAVDVEASTEVVAIGSSETPEFVKTIGEAWDKLDDKYAVTGLGVAAVVALVAAAGTISAIDRLPLVPGVLELIGIGYTGWFAYRNLFFTDDRQAVIEKLKCTYRDIIGDNSPLE